MLKRILIIFGIPAFLVGTLWVADIYSDRQWKVEVIKDAQLLTLSPLDYPITNPIALNIHVGDKVSVLRVRYGKDFEAMQLETFSGQTGWILSGDEIRVISR